MTFRKTDGVISRREGENTLVFKQQSRDLVILNPTSTFIWEHCTGELTPREITDLLAKRFEVPVEYAEPSRLLGFVTGHLDLLRRAELLVPTTA